LSKYNHKNVTVERKNATYASQSMPSPPLPKPCRSGDKTVKPFCGISVQFNSCCDDGIQKSGYDESQSPVAAGVIGNCPYARHAPIVNTIISNTEQIPTLYPSG